MQRYSVIIHQFGRPVPQLSMIFNEMIDIIDTRWGFLLQSLEREWLNHEKLFNFASAVYNKGTPLDNVSGFVDGTMKATSKPSRHQITVCNGYKRKHALKYQLISTPNGLIANLFGPVEGK